MWVFAKVLLSLVGWGALSRCRCGCRCGCRCPCGVRPASHTPRAPSRVSRMMSAWPAWRADRVVLVDGEALFPVLRLGPLTREDAASETGLEPGALTYGQVLDQAQQRQRARGRRRAGRRVVDPVDLPEHPSPLDVEMALQRLAFRSGPEERRGERVFDLFARHVQMPGHLCGQDNRPNPGHTGALVPRPACPLDHRLLTYAASTTKGWSATTMSRPPVLRTRRRSANGSGSPEAGPRPRRAAAEPGRASSRRARRRSRRRRGRAAPRTGTRAAADVQDPTPGHVPGHVPGQVQDRGPDVAGPGRAGPTPKKAQTASTRPSRSRAARTSAGSARLV